MTIREIATIANVSTAAVSIVLNNKKGVSDETRERILSVMEKNNYVTRRQTKKRSEGCFCLLKYSTHGMIVEENQGFIASILDYIESTCTEKGISLVLRGMNSSNAVSVLQALAENPVDGILLIGTELEDEQVKLIQQIKTPVVVIDNSMRYYGITSVVMANHGITYEAVSYLYKLGHRDIGYLKSNTPISNFNERSEGFFYCIDSLGLKRPKPFLLLPTMDGAYLSMKKLISQPSFTLPTALFADNDTIAIGAIKAIKESGYKVPDDVSVIGVDDIKYSSVVNPGLTTIRISRRLIGTAAVEIMQRRVQHPNEDTLHMLIEGKLIVRESTREISI